MYYVVFQIKKYDLRAKKLSTLFCANSKAAFVTFVYSHKCNF